MVSITRYYCLSIMIGGICNKVPELGKDDRWVVDLDAIDLYSSLFS